MDRIIEECATARLPGLFREEHFTNHHQAERGMRVVNWGGQEVHLGDRQETANLLSRPSSRAWRHFLYTFTHPSFTLDGQPVRGVRATFGIHMEPATHVYLYVPGIYRQWPLMLQPPSYRNARVRGWEVGFRLESQEPERFGVEALEVNPGGFGQTALHLTRQNDLYRVQRLPGGFCFRAPSSPRMPYFPLRHSVLFSGNDLPQIYLKIRLSAVDARIGVAVLSITVTPDFENERARTRHPVDFLQFLNRRERTGSSRLGRPTYGNYPVPEVVDAYGRRTDFYPTPSNNNNQAGPSRPRVPPEMAQEIAQAAVQLVNQRAARATREALAREQRRRVYARAAVDGSIVQPAGKRKRVEIVDLDSDDDLNPDSDEGEEVEAGDDTDLDEDPDDAN